MPRFGQTVSDADAAREFLENLPPPPDDSQAPPYIPPPPEPIFDAPAPAPGPAPRPRPRPSAPPVPPRPAGQPAVPQPVVPQPAAPAPAEPPRQKVKWSIVSIMGLLFFLVWAGYLVYVAFAISQAEAPAAQSPAATSAPPAVTATPTSSPTAASVDTIYWTQSGKSYHVNPHCSTLRNTSNVLSGSLSDALAAGKSDPCNYCVPGQDVTIESVSPASDTQTGVYYWTPKGKSYHSTLSCPSLSHSTTFYSGSLSDAHAAGKYDPCDHCFK